jgi:hypothetical protein
MIGPGYYNKGGPENAENQDSANARKGVFLRTGRAVPDNRNPGPGAYRNLNPNAIGQNEEGAYCIPRDARPCPFVGKPEYDGRAFYK